MRTLFILMLLISVNLSGCAGTVANIERDMQVWVGRPISDLIMTWGAPSEIIPSAIGTAYIWKFKEFIGSGDGYRIRTFWVDNQGIITRYSWRGIGVSGF